MYVRKAVGSLLSGVCVLLCFFLVTTLCRLRSARWQSNSLMAKKEERKIERCFPIATLRLRHCLLRGSNRTQHCVDDRVSPQPLLHNVRVASRRTFNRKSLKTTDQQVPRVCHRPSCVNLFQSQLFKHLSIRGLFLPLHAVQWSSLIAFFTAYTVYVLYSIFHQFDPE